VGVEISRSRGESEVDVGRRVRELAQKLQQDRPDLKLTETMDFATPAQEEFDRTMHTLYEGAALAVIVVWFFLRNWRATFLSAVAPPLSVPPAFPGRPLAVGPSRIPRIAAGTRPPGKMMPIVRR